VLVLVSAAGTAPALPAAPPGGGDAAGVEFFETRIRPLLATTCYQCHSRESKKAKGGLLLDSPEGLLKGGDSGPLVVAGDPEKSLLLKAVRHSDNDLRMPPDGAKLTGAQIADLAAWVKRGAPLPRAGRQDDSIAARARTHWAFQPVTRPAIPAVKNRSWVQSPVDAFILARLEDAGVRPAPPADKRTLIRRATYDLIGLPPTPEEVAAFAADTSPEAFAAVVDRLLASPHYGERWGRHWLDVARYASTDGPYAFTYRDYVIGAFNADLPYDEFLIQQLAADRLDLGADKRPLAGLGFLTLGRQFESVHDTIDDRIDVVTRGTMALTVTCARCHDHKYDPIPTRDYYALHGVFASSVAPDEMPVLGIAPDPKAYAEYSAKRKPLQEKWEAFIRKQQAEVFKQHRRLTAQYLLLSREPTKVAELDKEAFALSDRKILRTGAARWLKALEKLDPESDPIFAPWFAFAALPASDFAARAKAVAAKLAASPDRTLNPLVARAFAGDPPTSLKDVAERYGKLFEGVDERWQEELRRDAGTPKLPDADEEALRQVFYGTDGPGNLPAEVLPSLYTVSALMQLEPLQAQITRLDATHPGAPQRAMALVDGPRPANSRVFIRGNPNRLGEEVPRQFLSIVAGDKRQPFARGSGRLELARAVAGRDNPLTARVMVNRVWLHHFGAGLVTTPDDFGLRSDPPSHPELLDYLAWRFAEDGWSLKKLHRAVMLSSVYQQSSDDGLRHEKRDPDNRLLAKANRRRLDFESTRDTLLFVAGNLDPSAGGRPVDLLKPRDGAYPNRRTVYGSVDRNDLLSLFRTFDFANPDITTAQRDATTVPQQALFFLNSPFVMEQAAKMVSRPAFQRLDDPERVRDLYRRAYQRDPSAKELRLGLQFLRAEPAPPDAKEQRALTAWERYAQVLLMSNELMFVD
jgi:cytochrome c553